MPIYEYQCDFCGHKFECLICGDKEPLKCCYCAETAIRRILSVCGFVSVSKKNAGGNTYSTPQSSSSSCGGCTASNCSSCK